MMTKRDNIVDFKPRQESQSQLLERLFAEHGKALRTFLLGRTGGSPEVDDIVQDVFIRLSRMEGLRDKLVGARASRAYIFTAASRLLVDRSRRNKVHREYLETEKNLAGDPKDDASPEVMAEQHELLKEIEKAIAKMPIKWQKAFVLSRFEYMSHKEISEIMGLSVKSVQRYISSALGEIRKAASKVDGKWS